MKIRFVCADNCHDMQAPVTLKKGHFSRVISPIFKGTSLRVLFTHISVHILYINHYFYQDTNSFAGSFDFTNIFSFNSNMYAVVRRFYCCNIQACTVFTGAY